jgi:hypothetical protein
MLDRLSNTLNNTGSIGLKHKPGKRLLERLIIDRRLIFKWVGMCGLDSSDSQYGLGMGFCEHGNKPSEFHERCGFS